MINLISRAHYKRPRHRQPRHRRSFLGDEVASQRQHLAQSPRFAKIGEAWIAVLPLGLAI